MAVEKNVRNTRCHLVTSNRIVPFLDGLFCFKANWWEWLKLKTVTQNCTWTLLIDGSLLVAFMMPLHSRGRRLLRQWNVSY